MAAASGTAPTTAMVDQASNQPAVPAVTQLAAAAAPAVEALQAHPNSSLCVGDLDKSVNEAHLLNLFNQVAPVQTVRVCRDLSHRSLGYAYVNFANPNDAMRAMDTLNYTPIKDRPIRIMRSNRDPSTRLSGKGNVFIKNLDVSIDNKDLYDTFSTFGTILSCKVEMTLSGRSRGYGFVQFEKVETAQAAIEKLNGMLLNDKKVFVGHFVRHQDRTRSENRALPRFTNVYVKNLPKEIDDDKLKKTFEKYGDISSAVVMKDESGNSKCFGFVNYQRSEDAAVAVEKMNGTSLGENVLFVGKAQKKSEREEELKRKHEQEKLNRFEKLEGSNLYVKNLDDSVDDEKLKEMFSEYGNVTSSKVMMNSGGLSRGFGFVAYSLPEEASKAMNDMSGKKIGKKPLYVALAQRKEERRNYLQTKFSQMRPNGTMTPIPMPGFHQHPSGGAMAGPPHHQMYIGQNGQGLMPSQPMGYGYQLQLMPRPRSGLADFVMPYPLHRQNQHGPWAGFRRGATNMQQQHFQQQQMHLQSLKMLLKPHRSHHHSPISKLTSALALASPAKHSQMLGEQLFPLVEKQEPVHTAKVTGMLLQMDQAEILHLLEAPEALKTKVSEALIALGLSANSPAVSSA
uniref:Polyadenylate-binding protein n=1 Tax=Brassica campestris TaxID=3711 RepID=M4CUT9_BRACM